MSRALLRDNLLEPGSDTAEGNVTSGLVKRVGTASGFSLPRFCKPISAANPESISALVLWTFLVHFWRNAGSLQKLEQECPYFIGAVSSSHHNGLYFCWNKEVGGTTRTSVRAQDFMHTVRCHLVTSLHPKRKSSFNSVFGDISRALLRLHIFLVC